MSGGNALVTGANRGIGLALVRALLANGWNVVATARDVSQATELASTGARVMTLDVMDDASCAACATEIDALDVLVNNAAIFPEEGDETLAQIDLNCFTSAFATNVVGVARVTRAFIPALERSQRARIVNVSSGAGSISEKEDHAYYAYSTSKAALNMLTRAMAAEFRPKGIAVFALSPGWVKTEMGGPNAVLTPEDSARAIAATVDALNLEKTGKFLNRHGNSGEYEW